MTIVALYVMIAGVFSILLAGIKPQFPIETDWSDIGPIPFLVLSMIWPVYALFAVCVIIAGICWVIWKVLEFFKITNMLNVLWRGEWK